jgi:hypothetical protein
VEVDRRAPTAFSLPMNDEYDSRYGLPKELKMITITSVFHFRLSMAEEDEVRTSRYDRAS